MGENEVGTVIDGKRGEREKGETRGGGERGERCGLEYGFGFPSFRGELKTIDTEAESEADRVAAQGCTGTQPEHDLHAHKVTGLTPRRMWWYGGQAKIRKWRIVELELGMKAYNCC